SGLDTLSLHDALPIWSGTRGRRGPRKPPRRDAAFASPVQVVDPRERGAIELPGTITVKELADLLGVNVADVIRELIKSGILATRSEEHTSELQSRSDL